MAFGRYESQRPTTPTNPDAKEKKGWTPARITAAAAASLLTVVVGFPVLVAFIGSWDNIDAGHVAVLRNGGFANQNIRGFLNPGSGMTYTGLFSTEHIYPAQQQVYTISADPTQGNTATADSIDVPSSDGVEITIDGTLYYSLNLTPAALGQFDDRYGTQTYVWGGQSLHPYDGSDGWNAFVNAVVRPTLQNELRTALSQVSCASVDPACALVKNSTQAAAVASGSTSGDGNLVKIQNEINSELVTDLENQLGGDYFQGLRFTISTVTLPASVQTAIDTAQAAFAAVSSAQASVNAATLQAQANTITQQGYAACPVCGVIAEEKALPGNITTYAPGAGFAVGSK